MIYSRKKGKIPQENVEEEDLSESEQEILRIEQMNEEIEDLYKNEKDYKLEKDKKQAKKEKKRKALIEQQRLL